MKKKIINILFNLGRLNYNILSRIRAWADYKSGEISFLEYNFRKAYLKSKNRYAMGEFYQSYPPLNIRGMRPTLVRYKVYGLDKLLNKDISLLDIGGNIGFFSSYLSQFVKKATILEIDSELVKITKKLIMKEKLSNVNQIHGDFVKVKFKEKFDFVMSLAVHGYMDCSFEDYIKKIHSICNKDAFLLFETHRQEWLRNEKMINFIENNKYFKVIKMDYTDDNTGIMRRFYICKKKQLKQ